MLLPGCLLAWKLEACALPPLYATVDPSGIGIRIEADLAADRVVAVAGDVNGDGRSDLIIGDRSTNAAYLFYGPVAGDVNISYADAVLVGAAGDGAGSAVAGAGDVNGDGYADILVGAPDHEIDGSHGGAVYLVYGPVYGTVDLRDAGPWWFGEPDTRSGASVAAAGDLDLDGFADFLIGAPGGAGAVYVIRGGQLTGQQPLTGADLTIESSSPGSGLSAAAAGDVNADGYADLIVGVPGASAGASESGAAYLLPGPLALDGRDMQLGDSNSVTLAGGTKAEWAGYIVRTAGDLNGDGRDDLQIGAPGAEGDSPGAVYLLYGPVSGDEVKLDSIVEKMKGELAGGHLGFTLSGQGDVNGDGYADLLIGAPGAEAGSSGVSGAAYLIFGPADGIDNMTAADIRFVTNRPESLGFSVSLEGDLDGDGQADIILGTRGTVAAYIVYSHSLW